jgi:(Z)-2-((N-methylformamido)methylene)-5-hydroxybutyrolactone dehydrogenase
MSDLERFEHYIGGERVAPSSGEYFESTNPATRTPLYEAARGNAADVSRAVQAASATFEDPRWRDLSQTRRGHLLRRLGDLIGEHADELARMETQDNGKLLREMRAQLATLPEYYFYYAGLADKIQGDVIPTSDRRVLNYTTREPLGVVGAITPWNSPLTLTTSKLAPALCAGNTVVIKP